MAHTTPPERGLFADIIFAKDLKLRTSLLKALLRVVDCRRLSRAGTAELLGIDEARLGELLRGSVHAFTAEELMRMLELAGICVEQSLAR